MSVWGTFAASVWLMGSTVAQASVCSSGSTGTAHCYAPDNGRVSAVVANQYESDGLQGYACSTSQHAGVERITSFTCHYPNDVHLVMTGTQCDVDLFVLDDTCDPVGQCIAGNTAPYNPAAGTSGDYPVDFFCVPGKTYFLVVEAKTSSGGTACPTLWRDIDEDGVQDPAEVGPGSRFELLPFCTESCDDGWDNDRDGAVDCDDATCLGTPACCDHDGDGVFADTPSCGMGGDCDDEDPYVADGFDEIPADGLDQDCDGVDDCFVDADGDGLGGAATAPGNDLDCVDPIGESAVSGDCDDGDPLVRPGAAEVVADGADQDCDGADDCWRDLDLDGWGADVAVAGDDLDCTNLPGEAAVRGDCRDDLPLVHPGAGEVVADGVDQDCDGVDHCFPDADGDGFGVAPAVPGAALSCTSGFSGNSDDCRDAGVGASAVHPGATETCDGVDDDCDGLVDDADDGVSGGSTWYLDSDGDGFGGPVVVTACEAPPSHLATGGDCADDAAAIHPGAAERCDGVDNDCDLLIDDEDAVTDLLGAWVDADGDGYGDTTRPAALTGCVLPPGYAPVPGDCDDGQPAIHPGAVDEPYDGVDQDCVGGDLLDIDGDGFSGGASGSDCFDRSAEVRPGAVEHADGVDEDCDGRVDEGTEAADDDGDGFSELGGDCADDMARRHPGAEETCDGLDEDCDGRTDEGTPCTDDDGDGVAEIAGDCHDGDPAVRPGAPDTRVGVDSDCDGDVLGVDVDGDGWAAAAGDCQDGDPGVRPGLDEIADGLDQDCDGLIDEGTAVADDDGDGASEAGGDCHDGDPSIGPSAPEIASNGVDDDCDHRVDEVGAMADADGDGFTPDGGDCDDASASIAPDAAELGNGVDDDCDGRVDEDTADVDEDGWTAAAGDCDDAMGWVHPSAEEACDGLDNDCDGVIDPGCTGRDGPDDKAEEARPRGCFSVGGGGWLMAALVLAVSRRRSKGPTGQNEHAARRRRGMLCAIFPSR